MKKLIIVMIIAAIACTSVFAGSLSLGFSQGLINTSFVASYEWDKFGVQGDVGLPIVFSSLSLAGAIQEKAEKNSEKEIDFLDFILPGAHIGAYWKAVDGNHFGWNLGLGGTIQSYFAEKKFRVFGGATLTSGISYKFNERFSIGLDSSIPIALVLYPINEDIAKYTCFMFVEGSGEPEDLAMALWGFPFYLINDLARLTFKWTI